MSDLIVAVADSPFPSLDPVEKSVAPARRAPRMSASSAAQTFSPWPATLTRCMVCYAKLPGDLIRQLTRCKVIGRTGLGVDNIDLAAARERKIVVTYVPDYCMDEVSDHAMALMLALARKVPFANSLVQGGRWEMAAVAPIHRLKGQTLGLVGFGNIPRALVPKAKAFGLRVLAFDPFVAPDVFASVGVEGVGFDAAARLFRLRLRFTLRSRLRREVCSTQAHLHKMKPGALHHQHRTRASHRRKSADRGPGQRPTRRRRARRARDRASAQGLAADRQAECGADAPHGLLFGGGARGAADQMRDRRRPRLVGATAGLPRAGLN